MTNFGFVTCVQLGLSCIEAIYDVGGRLELLVTLPDNRAVNKSGRIYLDDLARKHDVPLVKVGHVNDPEARAAIEAADLDWLFIIGWSQIAGNEVLEIPRKGVIGMHPTLLPEGRGRAAIPWAILKGLGQTGVTMFKMDAGVDTGPIISQRVVPLHDRIDAAELYAAIDRAQVELMKQAFPLLAAGTVELQVQDEELATEWPGRKPEDGRIDLASSVHEAERLVRAVTAPYPGAFFDDAEGRVIVWQARILPDGEPGELPTIAFSDGKLELLRWERVFEPDGAGQ